MDPRRFDDLTRRLSTSTSRRTILKGLAGAALGGLLAQLPGEDATAAPKPKKPKPCLPEGKKSKDPSRCCSLKTSNGVCCGEESGSCIISGCCSEATPFCWDGTCVYCLPENAPSSVAGYCCSLVLEDGVCCGTQGGSCAESGCCAESNQLCDNGLCVNCLPEGASSSDPAKCCGGRIQDGVCRLEECLPLGATTTDSSLCCSLLSLLGVCVQCYPEGTISDEPLECCSEAVNAARTCCGVAGGSCEASGCCTSGFTCCNGICFPICPPPMTHNPDTCLCEVLCSANASVCTQDSDCCSGSCCNGVCVDTQSDITNCGSCGRRCIMCQDGICGMPCEGEFCPFPSYCIGNIAKPDNPRVCCPVCPPGDYPIPYNCGDDMCCCSPWDVKICNGNTCGWV